MGNSEHCQEGSRNIYSVATDTQNLTLQDRLQKALQARKGEDLHISMRKAMKLHSL